MCAFALHFTVFIAFIITFCKPFLLHCTVNNLVVTYKLYYKNYANIFICNYYVLSIYLDMYCIFSLTDVHFGELQHMFLIDPYLLRFFVFKIDSNYLSSIFEKVPMSILIMRLTRDCLYSIKVSFIIV